MAKKNFQKTRVTSSEKYSEIFSSFQNKKGVPVTYSMSPPQKKGERKWSYHVNQLHLELISHPMLCPDPQMEIFPDLNLHGGIH